MTTATRFDLSNALRIYSETIAPLHARYLAEENAGGKMRASMGDLYETIAQAVIYAVDPSIVCKHNDYILVESKGGKHLKRTQVDLHCYKDGELAFIVEGKTYIDASYQVEVPVAGPIHALMKWDDLVFIAGQSNPK